jgi:hypothetical protein
MTAFGGAEKLSALTEAANQLPVALIAQEPDSVSLTLEGVRTALKVGLEQRYTIMPIREPDHSIRRFVTVEDMRRLKGDLPALHNVATPIRVEDVVALESPILSLLGRFQEQERELLFVLGPTGVSGVVTIYDLNQPAAQLFGFGLAVVVEAEITRIIDEILTSREPSVPIDEQVELRREVQRVK